MKGAFEKCKYSISKTTRFAFPNPSLDVVIITDAGNISIGRILDQLRKES